MVDSTKSAQWIYNQAHQGLMDGETMHALFFELTGEPSPVGRVKIQVSDIRKLAVPGSYVGDACIALIEDLISEAAATRRAFEEAEKGEWL